MLTTKQASERLEMQPRSVVALIKQGRIAAAKDGRSYLIPEEEVARYRRERLPMRRPPKLREG